MWDTLYDAYLASIFVLYVAGYYYFTDPANKNKERLLLLALRVCVSLCAALILLWLASD